MASVSSLLKAARSVADRKRTSVSTARVARRLPASFARRARSPTSRTTRAPRAMKSSRTAYRFPVSDRADRTQGARRNDVGSGRRHEQPFGQAAPLAFLCQPHQPVRFQRVQVVVDFLPSQADPRGQRRRRGGRGQLREESTPHGLQRDCSRCRIFDDLDVEHERR